jgi:hypothetical protein
MIGIRNLLLPTLLIIGIISSCRWEDKKHQDYLDIIFWYGDHQEFGKPGLAQRWINILGNVQSDHGIRDLYYTLNGADTVTLSWGQDNHRLANIGDFNIDIHFKAVNTGRNKLCVTVLDSADQLFSKEMTFDFNEKNSWPLPYTINWSKIENIQDAVQVVDGHWEITPQGIRTMDPWYDRVLAIGDSSWKNYDVVTSVIFHGYTSPVKGPPNYGVSHVALASRWPGHDWDEHQPHQKWYPLGATCEFQLKDNLDSCRWRILGDRNIKTEDTHQHFAIQLGEWYKLKSRVESVTENMTRYRVKIWSAKDPEPAGWQLTGIEGRDDLPYGSALIIAHNTDVTFGNVMINPVE